MQPYEHRLTVPFGHCDIAGIVYTPRFAEYCMEAAEFFLRSEVGLDWLVINQERSCVNPVMRFEIDFHDTVYISDELRLTIFVSKVGNSSFELRILGEKKTGDGLLPCFSASLVLAIVDPQASRSMAIPEHWRNRLERYRQLSPAPYLQAREQNHPQRTDR